MTTAVEPREHAVEARGLTFHYVEWGSPDAHPIVLLHGISAMCRIWDWLAQDLQDRYRLIALDQRGHGDTGWPPQPDYATDDYLGDLEALVGIWGLGRFSLIGLSMGGMNAMAYAARHPERIAHLVAVDIRPAVNPDKRANRDLDRNTAEHGHGTVADLEQAHKLRALLHPHTPEASLRHHLRHLLKQQPDGRWVNKHDPRVSYYWRPRNLWAELSQIDAPVLIVRGGKSEVLPPDVADQMRDAFPNAELALVADAAHTVPEDRPQEFNAIVADFLGRHPIA
jgi:pimeloyl-ACP methyl ester carboxylesterase